MVGDFVVYYEPRRSSGEATSRGGRQAYFAVARVTAVEPDPVRDDHFYARIADYLEFDRPVPFREGGHFYETGLRRNDGQTSKGAFGRAVRMLPDQEFNAILRAGFANDELLLPGPNRQPMMPAGFEEPQADFERPIVESLMALDVPACFASGKQRLELFARQLAIAEDLGEEARPDRLAGMHGHGRAASVRVAQDVMAAAHARDAETGSAKSRDDGPAVERRQPRHAATEMRCTPMNSNAGASSPRSSRFSAIASRTRSINSSRERACVWQPGSAGTDAT